jgi:gamma-glutamyltranspeptidase / glutathione hydrolase
MGMRSDVVFGLSLVLCGCAPSHAAINASGTAPATSAVTQNDAPAPTPFPPDWAYPAGAPRLTSTAGVVTTDAALATRVGTDVLSAGGNAVDAAVAAAFALAVVFPTAGNIGGGGFLVAMIGGKPYALDFRETAPLAATHDMYLGSDGKPTRDSREGIRSVGVPGSVAGLWEAWSKLGSGKKAWAELVAPAIRLADDGFVVDAGYEKTIGLVQARLAKYPASAALFLPNGAPPPAGTTWRDPEFANVLRKIAEQGAPGFYEGPVAESIASTMRSAGGLITIEDLRRYRAKWRAPMLYEYRQRHIVGMPPPSSGGLTMAMTAHILDGFDLHAAGWHSSQEVHLMAEAMRRAFAARNAKLGDPDFVTNPMDELTSEAWARAQRATVRLDRATPTSELFPGKFPTDAGDRPPDRIPGRPEGGEKKPDDAHTTHMAVVDRAGNAVALTTTLNAWFGSGITVSGGGFVLNDEMDDFSSASGAANAFGLVQGEPNAIAPGKRMLSSMSPTIVLGAADKVELVLGAAGGSRIITTVMEQLSNVVDYGMNIGDAVRAPRFHQQDWPDVLLLEPHALLDAERRALEAMGHTIQETQHIGDAPAIGRVLDRWQGVAEPRREGSLALGPAP